MLLYQQVERVAWPEKVEKPFLKIITDMILKAKIRVIQPVTETKGEGRALPSTAGRALCLLVGGL